MSFAEIEESVGLAESGTTSRGGSIPVLGSPDHLDAENRNLLAQIHWDVSMRKLQLSPVTVAVIDTGVSPFATSLWSRTIRYRNQVPPVKGGPKIPYDLPSVRYPINSYPNREVGHGTMVGGLIAELAPNARFIFERVADGTGAATSWSVIRGLADAVTSHAQIINISLGSKTEIVAFEQAFAWATSQGVLIVAPAGNDGTAQLVEPANLDLVVSVTGVDSTDRKAMFSNWGTSAYASAPATGIRSVNWDGKMAIWSGTSFSAPLVAGELCLGLGRGMPIFTTNVDEFLKSGGDSIDALNPAYAGLLGNRIDVARFLQTNLGAVRRRP